MANNRTNWRQIVARNGTPENIGRPFVFILKNAGRDLLLSIFDTLIYRATYSENVPLLNEEEFDELQAIVADTKDGLIGGVPLNELTDRLDLLIAGVDALCGCIQTAIGGQPPTFPPGGAPDDTEGPDFTVPPNSDPGGQPSDFPDWPVYLDYKCKAAWAITQAIIQTFSALSGFGAVAATIAAYIGLMLITFPPAAFVALGAAAILVIITAVFALVAYEGWTFSVMGDMSAQLYTGTSTGYGQAAVVCDLYNSTGTVQSAAILRNWIRLAAEETLNGYPDITDVPGALALITLVASKIANNHLTQGLFRDILDVSMWENTCAECQPAPEEFTLIGGYGYTVYMFDGASRTVGSYGSVTENIFPISTHAFNPSNLGSSLNYTANVRSDLESFLDTYPGVLQGGTLQNPDTDFNGNWDEPGLQFGVFTNQFNGGHTYLIAMDFKILCATATDPNNWIWLDAYMSTLIDNTEEYVVVPGYGQAGTIEIDVTLNDSSALTRRIHLWPTATLPPF